MKQIKPYFSAHPTLQKSGFMALALLCLTPVVSAPVALILGFLAIQFIGNPYQQKTSKLTHSLLKISVVGLGFGMNINSALEVGKEGFLFTIASIASVFTIGYLLSRLFDIKKTIGYLISSGTAICGGSAIAAVSAIIKAKESHISVSLAVVFVLNSVALLLFPLIGHALDLTQYEFGLWSAIAIHDTSSVVGAAASYGAEALKVATTVKLARALWIIPVSFISAWLFNNSETKIKIPWFIGGFVVAMCLNTFVPVVQQISPVIVNFSRLGLQLTLFLIGASLPMKKIKDLGVNTFLMAVLLWAFIAIGSLWVIAG